MTTNTRETGAGFGLVEFRWCGPCADEVGFERAGGDDGPEAFCVDCGTAVFLWVDLPEQAPALPIAA